MNTARFLISIVAVVALSIAVTFTVNFNYNKTSPDTLHQGNTYNISFLNSYNTVQGDNSKSIQKE